ncbi:hypothetical protein L0128_04885 [candidate division KSB1 bacterium]|nr:hypothetical protein [candidate division KSB1 bacterium]
MVKNLTAMQYRTAANRTTTGNGESGTCERFVGTVQADFQYSANHHRNFTS